MIREVLIEKTFALMKCSCNQSEQTKYGKSMNFMCFQLKTKTTIFNGLILLMEFNTIWKLYNSIGNIDLYILKFKMKTYFLWKRSPPEWADNLNGIQ